MKIWFSKSIEPNLKLFLKDRQLMDLPANIGASNIFKYNQQTACVLFELANKDEFLVDMILKYLLNL